MSFPKGRHLDSIAYSRKRSYDSGLHRAIRRSTDNLSDNAIRPNSQYPQTRTHDFNRVYVACLVTATPDSPQLLVPKMRGETGVVDAVSLLYSAELVKTLPTGGMGGVAGNACAVQFANGLGAVVNS